MKEFTALEIDQFYKVVLGRKKMLTGAKELRKL